ncbi:hypothetical protein H5410_047811 [Solanum commersonii]|uniref:Uncharacterized protein n=1 Tax=Solanum commersonii TaxID=4109 RepID=A0A9J5XG84_SOLCO|nr:hypothetical protein H5410_047811 [Solanum commersonii]
MSTKGRVINKGRTIKYRQGNGKTSCLGTQSTNEGEHSTKRSRGRPPHLVHLRDPQRGQEEDHWHLAALTKGARGRPPIAPQHLMHPQHPQKSARGRPISSLVHLLHVHHR